MDPGKTKINKKVWYLSGLVLLVLIAALAFNFIFPASAALGDEQISELRSKYPVYEGSPPLAVMRERGLKEMLSLCDAVILGEVTEALPEYSVVLVEGNDTPEGKIYEKGEQLGLQMQNIASFMQYRVKVAEVISAKSSGQGEGDDGQEADIKSQAEKTSEQAESISGQAESISDDIIIAVNSQLRGYMPEPEAGMRIVTPVKKGDGKHDGKYFYSRVGFYYVTDDGFVLSAYVEDEDNRFTGRTLEYLKRKIKGMM